MLSHNRIPLAHGDGPFGPDDLWSMTERFGFVDAMVALGLLLVVVVYRRGRTWGGAERGRRSRLFHSGVIVVALALLSPLDGAADSLASAHMIQHLLLGVIAAPLLALARPGAVLLRGSPSLVRALNRRVQRAAGPAARGRLREAVPVAAWLAAAGTLWFWHGARAYEAALANDGVHWLQHASFLVTGVAFWSAIVGAGGLNRPGPGLSMILLFFMTMQGALLATLLVFAPEPWYETYRSTAPAWGLDPLTDQRLAGVMMWLVSGAVHLAAALVVLLRWVFPSEGAEPRPLSIAGSGHGRQR